MSADNDPIFAAIQACRTAKETSGAAYARKKWLHALADKKFGAGPAQKQARNAFVDEALGGDQDAYSDAPAVALWDSYGTFAQTVPTTLAGLFAMLVFAGEIAELEPEALEDMEILATLATAAKALCGTAAPGG